MKPEEDIQAKNYHDFDANSDIPMPSCKNQSRTGEQGEIKKIGNTEHQIFCLLVNFYFFRKNLLT